MIIMTLYDHHDLIWLPWPYMIIMTLYDHHDFMW